MKFFTKKTIKALLLGILVIPGIVLAQLTIPQGGTGLDAFSQGSVPFMDTGSLRLATSSAFQFSNSTSQLTTTNAVFTTATSTTFCLTGDDCITSWSAGAGTVTSVAQTVPTGFTVAGSPITTAGTLAISFDTGYEGLLSTDKTNWNTFYTTPSSRITDGTNLSWSTNTLNVDDVFLANNADDTTTGTLTIGGDLINGTKNVTDYLKFWNSTFQEQFTALITSDGTNATTTLELVGGGDLTKRFSSGDTTLDCTPICEIAMTVGTDSSPQSNYTYVLESTGALTNNTTGWPSAEHIKVSYSFLQSASSIQTDGAYILQNWNDAASNGNNTGHITHITQWIREQGATWFSGTAGEGSDGYVDLVAAGSEAYIKIGAGLISQVHQQTFSAVDTSSTSDNIHVVNHPTTPYLEISDLLDVMVDSTGSSLSGKYYNIVIGGIANKTGTHSPVMLNLPSGSYSNESNALNDVDGYDNYTMPREFGKESSTGFYLARITLKNAGGTTGSISVSGETDLRGIKQIQSVSGAGAGGSITDFSDSQFSIFSNLDPTKIGTFDLSSVTTGNTRTLTWPDSAGTIALTSDLTIYLLNNADDSTSGRLTIAGGINASTTSYFQADAVSNLVARIFENTGGEYFDVKADANGDLIFVNDSQDSVLLLDDASGDVGIGFDLSDINDTDTFLDFTTADDNFAFFVGGLEFLDFTENTVDTVTFNANGNNIGTIIKNGVATILDIAASTNLVTALGEWDLGGATGLEIPNGTAPTTDATGEIALDTTDNQLIVDDGTTDMVYRGEDVIFKVGIASTSVEFISGGIIPLPLEKDGFVLTQFRCYVENGTSIVVNLSDGTNDTETITCATTATSDTDVATNDTFTADELAEIQIGTITGTPDYLSFTAYGHWTRE